MDWITDIGVSADARQIAQFQVDMALESENTVLDYETVLKGVKAGLEDEAKGTYFVARDEQGRCIGSLFLTREWSDWNNTWYWWIQSVYVMPEYRRRGVFSSLYEMVKSKAKQSGISCLRLYVDHLNERAKQCYHRQGMSESHYLFYEQSI